jgi:hypothetical protein
MISQAIIISLITSQLSPLQDTFPIFTIDLLQAVDFDMKKYDWPTTSGQILTWIDFDI